MTDINKGTSGPTHLCAAPDCSSRSRFGHSTCLKHDEYDPDHTVTTGGLDPLTPKRMKLVRLDIILETVVQMTVPYGSRLLSVKFDDWDNSLKFNYLQPFPMTHTVPQPRRFIVLGLGETAGMKDIGEHVATCDKWEIFEHV